MDDSPMAYFYDGDSLESETYTTSSALATKRVHGHV
jgi:hypothetical protein